MTDLKVSFDSQPDSQVLEAWAVSPGPLPSTLEERFAGLGQALERAGFEAKAGQSYAFTSADFRVVAVIGMGASPTAEDARVFGFRAAKLAREHGLTGLVVTQLPAVGSAARLVVEGASLGSYVFTAYHANDRPVLERVCLPDAAQSKAAEEGLIRAACVRNARDLANGASGEVTPTRLAEFARAQVEALSAEGHDVELRVLEREDAQQLGMGCYLGVAQGSDEPPKFIHLHYKPKGKSKKTICLIGKGVTFDSGGYSLKTAEGMYGMKLDMSGSAAVLAAFEGIVKLGAPYEVHILVAAAENLVSGRAYRPGDVLVASDGTTVEINNTDAEGRLTMADALVYARGLSPEIVIDFATLTGACIIALGPHHAGVMTDDDALWDAWDGAAKHAGEGAWRLPLPESLDFMLESKIADCRNTGERAGGALTAGLFLKKFAKPYRWMHVDIAGPAMCNRPFGVNEEGGTGYAVASILEALAGGYL